MPWYKTTIRYGPGHQALDESYDYWNYDLSKEEQKELIFEKAYHDGLECDCSSSHGSVAKVDKLPEDVKQKKIKFYNGRIHDAQFMLKILENS